MDRRIGNIQTEVAMKIREVFKMSIEVIVITIEVEVLQIIDSNRGQVINDITCIRNRSYSNQYRGCGRPQYSYENSYYNYGGDSIATPRPAVGS